MEFLESELEYATKFIELAESPEGMTKNDVDHLKSHLMILRRYASRIAYIELEDHDCKAGQESGCDCCKS